jgi:hypothetical protein
MMKIKIGVAAPDVALEDRRSSGGGINRRFIWITPFPLQ